MAWCPSPPCGSRLSNRHAYGRCIQLPNISHSKKMMHDVHVQRVTAIVHAELSSSQTEEPAIVSDDDARELLQATTRRISALGRAGQPRDAINELASIVRRGVQPDAMAATAAVAACANNGKMKLARSVFDEIFGEMVQPDSIVFAVMVRGYGRQRPPDWTSITSLLNEMETRFALKPDTAVYTALLETCAASNDVERCGMLLERMRVNGVYPDEFTMQAVNHKKAMRSALKRVFDL